ncbi:MMPL family transporter [Thermogutta sp.]|uniref:MMPL family transporter n=1 Tax=Thermogutta sp. TaxID=1962930 RepID=UPI003C7BA7FC
MPQVQNTHFLASLSRRLVTLATYRPALTVALGGVIAAVSLFAGARFIEIHTSRADLLNPRNEYHRRWLAYVQEFSDQEDVYVVVQGDSPDQIKPILAEIAGQLEEYPEYFHSVLWRVDKDSLKRKGLYYLPKDELAQIARKIVGLQATVSSQLQLFDPAAFVVGLAHFVAQSGSPQALLRYRSQLAESLSLLEQALESNSLSGDGSTHLNADSAFDSANSQGTAEAAPADVLSKKVGGNETFVSPDGRLGLLLLRFTPDSGKQFTRFSEHISTLRAILHEVEASHPGVSIGATGLPLLEYDEMKASTSSATMAVLSLAGVVFVFFAGFGGVRYPVAVSLSLLMGVIWSVGYVALAVGHLNILTSAFGAMLIGLGDYGVHFVSHYLEIKRRTHQTREALIETATLVGPGIATGAITTAAAFFAGAFTDFLGVAELGIIAGGGVLLCWLSDMTILPAIICLMDRETDVTSIPCELELAPWFRFIARAPRGITVGMVAATGFLALGLAGLRYDYNLLNLQPVGLDSVQTQEKLVTHMSRSSYFALSVASSLEEARRRKAEFLALPTVDRVEDLASVIPEDIAAKKPFVESIVAAMQPLANSATISPEQLDHALAVLANAASTLPGGSQLAQWIGQVRNQVRQLTPEELTRRLETHHQSVGREFPLKLELLRNLTTEPPELADLPPALVDRFVGRSGKHLLQIYCKGDFWDPATMREFVTQVRRVDPAATGNPIQIYEACHQMNRAYVEAAFYAFFAILIALYLDFQNLKDVLLALIPLFLGMVCLFGLMGWLNLPLNPANMITLPLILGIGIDNGVHIVHDFRKQGTLYKMPSNATLVAVVVNSLTTMIGFGALMLSPHRGLESLGRVLAFGVGFTLVTALLMPGFLRWIHGLLRGDSAFDNEWAKFLTDVLAEEATEAMAGGPDTPIGVPPRTKRLLSDNAQPKDAEKAPNIATTVGESQPPTEAPVQFVRPRRAA